MAELAALFEAGGAATGAGMAGAGAAGIDATAVGAGAGAAGDITAGATLGGDAAALMPGMNTAMVAPGVAEGASAGGGILQGLDTFMKSPQMQMYAKLQGLGKDVPGMPQLPQMQMPMTGVQQVPRRQIRMF